MTVSLAWVRYLDEPYTYKNKCRVKDPGSRREHEDQLLLTPMAPR